MTKTTTSVFKSKNLNLKKKKINNKLQEHQTVLRVITGKGKKKRGHQELKNSKKRLKWSLPTFTDVLVFKSCKIIKAEMHKICI